MRSPGFFGKKGRETGGPSRVPPPHKPPPQIPWYFGGMTPAAARRARPVQRSGHQGLQGNPDACRPRRGSACDMSARKTSGNARLVFALSVQPTAAMNPRIGGSRAGEAPRPFFLPISSGRNGGARRVGGAGGATDKNPAKPPSKKRRAPRGVPRQITAGASPRPTVHGNFRASRAFPRRATTGRPYGRRAESSRPTGQRLRGQAGG